MSRTQVANQHTFRAVTVNYRSKTSTLDLARNLASVNGCEELIIVNHDPEESFGDVKQALPIQVINEKNRGYGAGLNRGIELLKQYKGVVLLCNPDVAVLNPDAVPPAIDYLNTHSDIGCLLPALQNNDGIQQNSCRRFYTAKTIFMTRMFGRGRALDLMPEHFYLDRDRNDCFEVDWGSGAAMFVRTPLFPDTFRFDQRFFMYFEDVDLCAQIWKSGFKVLYYPQLKLRHDEIGMSRTSLRFLGMHLISALRFVRKYGGFPSREQLTEIGSQKTEVGGLR